MLSGALHMYFEEIESDAALCYKHGSTAAIHDRGNSLQIYRLFKRDEVTAQQIRDFTDALPTWEESLFFSRGETEKSWMKMQRDVEARMPKRNQHPIITRGVSWEGLPILIHAYKFEPDPVMKVELVLGAYQSPVPKLSLRVVAAMLRCHEYIVPEYISTSLPPYEKHEAKFLTIAEYLTRSMPENLYATKCLQRVSCHASNGVGSRDTLREHQGAIASHSKYGTSSKA